MKSSCCAHTESGNASHNDWPPGLKFVVHTIRSQRWLNWNARVVFVFVVVQRCLFSVSQPHSLYWFGRCRCRCRRYRCSLCLARGFARALCVLYLCLVNTDKPITWLALARLSCAFGMLYSEVDCWFGSFYCKLYTLGRIFASAQTFGSNLNMDGLIMKIDFSCIRMELNIGRV